MKPPKSILSKEFVWTPPANTDVAKTWARVRKEQRALEAEHTHDHAGFRPDLGDTCSGCAYDVYIATKGKP